MDSGEMCQREGREVGEEASKNLSEGGEEGEEAGENVSGEEERKDEARKVVVSEKGGNTADLSGERIIE